MILAWDLDINTNHIVVISFIVLDTTLPVFITLLK